MSPGLGEYNLSVHMDVPVIDMMWTDISDPHTLTGAHAIFKVTGSRISHLPITLHKLF
jgi:xanthine dehydrogenase YagR molybdenum-binding subunit